MKNLKTSYLRRFYAAILFDRMDLEVNKELISSGNVRQHLKSINLNIGFVDFIYDARSLPNNNFYEVDLSKEDSIKKDLNFQLIHIQN